MALQRTDEHERVEREARMNEVKVTKIQIGLWNATVLMVTFAIAIIPAALILGIVGVCLYWILLTAGVAFF